MAIVWDSIVPPDALSTFTRNVPVRQDYILDQILPNRYITDTRVAVDDVTITRQTAKFRAWDAPPAPLKRDTFVTKSVDLLPLGGMLGRGERERLRLEQARSGGQSHAAMINAIYDDATIGTEAVQTRAEVSRGDVLTDGKHTVAENGVVTESDFGVPGAHIVSAGTPWSTTATATPLADIRAWVAIYRATNGFNPGGFICSEDVFAYLMENVAIRNLYGPSTTNAPDLVTEDQIGSTLRARRLPPLLFIYSAQASLDGVSTAILPNDRVIFVPPAGIELGFTFWGLTATALEMRSQGLYEDFSQAPGIVGVVDKDVSPPYREDVFVDACMLPVLSNPRALFVADVL